LLEIAGHGRMSKKPEKFNYNRRILPYFLLSSIVYRECRETFDLHEI